MSLYLSDLLKLFDVFGYGREILWVDSLTCWVRDRSCNPQPSSLLLKHAVQHLQPDVFDVYVLPSTWARRTMLLIIAIN